MTFIAESMILALFSVKVYLRAIIPFLSSIVNWLIADSKGTVTVVGKTFSEKRLDQVVTEVAGSGQI